MSAHDGRTAATHDDEVRRVLQTAAQLVDVTRMSPGGILAHAVDGGDTLVFLCSWRIGFKTVLSGVCRPAQQQ
jgi:hypothetical protein